MSSLSSSCFLGAKLWPLQNVFFSFVSPRYNSQLAPNGALVFTKHDSVCSLKRKKPAILELAYVGLNSLNQRWEFIKENKKVRKHAFDQEIDQETKKKNRKHALDQKKRINFLFFLIVFLVGFLVESVFSFFFLTFLFSFIMTWF